MEFFDVLDESGKKTGKTVEREYAHQHGICHRVIHVWIINSNNQLLLQKRSKDKDWMPDMWDVSLGGHIAAGEDAKLTIVREFAEELGLDLEPSFDKVKYLYTFYETSITNNGSFIDNEFYDVYLLPMDIEPDRLVLQEEEVRAVQYLDYDAFKRAVTNHAPDFVPHEDGYPKLFEHLDRYLSEKR